MNTRTPAFYFLIFTSALSILEWSGEQAGVLFILTGGLLWLESKREGEQIPPVAFVVIAYLAAFPFPMLFLDLYLDLWNRVPPVALEYGMLWALRGFSAFALGYALVSRFGVRRLAQNPRDEAFYTKRLSYMLYILTSIGWLSMVAWAFSAMLFGMGLTFIESAGVGTDSGAGSLHQMLTFASELRYPFFLGFIVLKFWKQTHRRLNLLCVALVLISVIEIIIIGSKASLIRPVIVVLLAQSILSIKWNVRAALVNALAVIVIYFSFVAITEYRSLTISKTIAVGQETNFGKQVELFATAVVTILLSSDSITTRETDLGKEDIFGRFGSGMFSFSNLLAHTGRQSPFENAWQSVFVPVYAVVPRFLLPEKPLYFNSGDNASIYYGWNYGGIAVSLPGSFYYAWGHTGIILGMALMGGMFSYVIGRVRMISHYPTHMLIIMTTLLLSLIYVDMTFQAIITNLVRLTGILWLLHLLYPSLRGTMRRRISRSKSPMQNRSHA